MNTENHVAFVTGANRGIGRALVEALLAKGARRIYATARNPMLLEPVVALDRARVIPRANAKSTELKRSTPCCYDLGASHNS